MKTQKSHLFAGHDAGTESADYTGDKFIGKEQGDEHRTIQENSNVEDENVPIVLETCKRINNEFQKAIRNACEELGIDYVSVAQTVHKLLGGDGTATVFGIRSGVWDD